MDSANIQTAVEAPRGYDFHAETYPYFIKYIRARRCSAAGVAAPIAPLSTSSASASTSDDNTRSQPARMKVACLQFAPELGQVERNKARANEILENASVPPDLDWLILPEMALSGYNFPSLEAILPFLEKTTAGVTTAWARETALRYGCHVTVGYPEVTTEGPEGDDEDPPRRYNSTVTVSPAGDVLANYRKHFLYYTDETWASEGDGGFFSGTVGALGQVSHGICMDINPYKFVADWGDYEFASEALQARSPIIVLSNAWITRLMAEELDEDPEEPDLETHSYWLERMRPVLTSKPAEPITIIFANRCGQEGGVCYAGSSMVVKVDTDEVSIYERAGRKEEKLLIVDLNERPKWCIVPAS